MNLYGLNNSLLDLGLSDATLFESISSTHPMVSDRRHLEREEEDLIKLSSSVLKNIKRNSSPPKRRHDGTSPLPLGMDWSPPPRNWNGTSTIWPHDFHTGWSYCVTIPSWSMYAESRGSEPIVFYRVQIGLQSPEGVTTTYGVLRRYSDFLKLSSNLRQSFCSKELPPAPPKGLLRTKNRKHLEERRCSLEDWMSKVLSDIDFSRSAPVACFLELEAAARSAFRESSHEVPHVNLICNSSISSDLLSSQTDVSLVAGTSASAPNYNSTESKTFSKNNSSTLSKEFSEGKEEKYPQKSSDGRINLDQIHVGPSYTMSHNDDSAENSPGQGNSPVISHAKVLLKESLPKGTSSTTPNDIATFVEVHQGSGTSSKCSESVETSEALDTPPRSDLQFSPDTLLVLPLDEQQKTNHLITTTQQRLMTSKTDIEDLIARLNYLTTKVKDWETELESTKQIGKENLEQAISIERERFTKTLWDMEELRTKCMEMEFRLKAEQDQKAHAEATKSSIIKENEALRQELDSVGEQLKNLQKCHDEADLKSKSDVKLLVREVKSVRGSHSELQQELDRVSKEKLEFETRLQEERTKRACVDAANRKCLHECEILRCRLKECCVNFMVERENKLKMESPPDALDILDTSDNHIGLLLAEAQLLGQDVATPVTSSSPESDNLLTVDEELRKMLTDVVIDNAILRKQANSIFRCALQMTDAFPNS